MPRFSEPFSVPDPDADAWNAMVVQNNMLQAGNDPLAGSAVAAPGHDGWWINRPDISTARWMALRGQDVSGASPADPSLQAAAYRPDGASEHSVLGGGGRPTVSNVATGPATGTGSHLTGRLGDAEAVAKAINRVTAGPNTIAPLETGPAQGAIQRGRGQDVTAKGKVKFLGKDWDVSASGKLDPGAPAGEVDVSGVELHGPLGISLGKIPRLRLRNSPTGELDAELPDDVRIFWKKFDRGVYPIGTPDPPPPNRSR